MFSGQYWPRVPFWTDSQSLTPVPGTPSDETLTESNDVTLPSDPAHRPGTGTPDPGLQKETDEMDTGHEGLVSPRRKILL